MSKIESLLINNNKQLFKTNKTISIESSSQRNQKQEAQIKMHIQYTAKIRKILRQSKTMVPTYYQQFYSVLKSCCQNINSEDVTPDTLNQLSAIYAYCKQKIQDKLLVSQYSLPNCSNIHNYDKPKVSNNPSKFDHQKYYNQIHSQLSELLVKFTKYLPKNSTSKLIYSHFMDNNFYTLVQKQRAKAEQLIMSDSGNITPLVNPSSNNSSKIQNFAGLHNALKNKATGNKLHLNGTNQLSIVFWLNCFKFDYAVHFDVFWVNFQNYLNNTLTQNVQSKNSLSPNIKFYPNFIPNFNNQSVKEKIRQLVDPNNKYYVTSASCNQLFMHLQQPQLLVTLAQLTTAKVSLPMDYKSTRCLVLKYKQKQNSKELDKTNQISLTINNYYSPKCEKGESENAFKLITSSQNVPENRQILLTGISVAYQNKIHFNKYPPTIRFGSLNDNQICIKNKYISRRQFMIIQQLELQDQNQDNIGNTNNSNKFSGFVKRNKYGKVLYKSQRSEKYESMLLSKYYLVCLSPSNHTAVSYQTRIQTRPGLIFKIFGVHIQIVKIASVFAGITPEKSKIKKQENLGYNRQNNAQEGQGTNGFLQQKMNASHQNEVNFRLLTTLGAIKTEQNQQYDQREYDQTLQQLPLNKSVLVVDKKLQCKFLSGEKKNHKFLVEPQNPIININKQKFKFQVQDGVFYIPKNVQVLAKSANQVLSGHLSDKVPLKPGMTIVLQEIQFEILD